MNPISYCLRCTCVLMLMTASAFAVQTLSADGLRRLGRTAFEEGRDADAEGKLRLSLDQFQKDGDAFEIAQTLADLASVLLTLNRAQESEELLNRAVKMMPAAAHPSDASRVLGNLAAVYGRTGRYDAAVSTFSRAVRLLEDHQPDDPHMVLALSNLGAVYAAMGEYKKAGKHLERALQLAEKRFSADDPGYMPVLANLAAVAEGRKKWDLAESYLLRAVRIAALSLRPDHPDTAVLYEHLGVVHFRRRKLGDAEAELRRALDIYERNLGKEDFRTVSVALKLADVLTAEGIHEQAAAIYRDVLPIQERLEARDRRIRAELEYTRSLTDPELLRKR